MCFTFGGKNHSEFNRKKETNKKNTEEFDNVNILECFKRKSCHKNT